METNILEGVKAALCQQNYDLDESSITGASRLKEDLGIDSLDVIEVAMELEKEFSIELSDLTIDSWETVEDIVASVQSKLS